MSTKKQLLDPLGALCKIISLFFNDVGTKFSIQDNVLIIQEPTQYQFLLRSLNRENRENISELFYVIMRIIEWYLMPNNSLQVDKSVFSSPIYAVNYSSDGKKTNSINLENDTSSDILDNFNNDADNVTEPTDIPIIEKKYYTNVSPKSYESNSFGSRESCLVRDNKNSEDISKSDEIRRLVHYARMAFIKLQKTYGNGNAVMTLQYFIILLKSGLDGTYTRNLLPQLYLDNNPENDTLLDYHKLKNSWKLDRLVRICDLYDKCFSLHDLPVESGSSYRERDNLIKSYLKSIESIIDEANNDFQNLIKNSH